MIRDDERQVLTVANICENGKRAAIYGMEGIFFVFLLWGLITFFVITCASNSAFGIIGKIFFSVIQASLVVCFAIKLKEYLFYRNIEFEVVEAVVSSVTQRVEDEWHRTGKFSYKEAVLHYYMFFKDYGEIRCGESTKEGDVYYLAISKKDKKVIGSYSAIRYRFKG